MLEPGVVYPLGTPEHEPITVPNAQALKLGHFVDVRLHFKTAGDIKMQVETHKREGFYSEVLPEVSTPATQADVTRGSKTGKGSTLGTTKKGSAAAAETETTTSKAGSTTAPAARAATRASKRAAAERAAAAKAARAEAARAKATAPTATKPAATHPAPAAEHGATEHGAAEPAAAHPVGHGY